MLPAPLLGQPTAGGDQGGLWLPPGPRARSVSWSALLPGHECVFPS